MTQNNFFYNLNKRLADVTGESLERTRETNIANEAAMSSVESVFAKMNAQPAGQVVRESDSDKFAALRDKLPFEPDAEAPSHKDEFGNEIKNMARHLAHQGMRDAEQEIDLGKEISDMDFGDSKSFSMSDLLKGMKEEVDTGEYDARKTTPSNDEGVFTRFRERMKNLDKELDSGEFSLDSHEQLDELSPLKTRLYKQAAVRDADRHRNASNRAALSGADWESEEHGKMFDKRVKGISAANRSLARQGRPEELDEMFGFGKEDNGLLDYFISLFTSGGKRDAKATPEQVEKAFKAADREFGPLERDHSSENVVAGYLSELFGLKPSFAMAEEKADKDYDKDGEIESPKAEYMGSRDRAIKAAMKKPKTIKESMDDTDFINYVSSFYGPGGIYDMGASKDQIAQALDMYRDNPDTDFAADSVDRENIRDIMIDKMGLKFPEGGIKVNDIHLEESELRHDPDFQRVARRARELSAKDRCSQHVNRREDGSFYISDWYDADETVASFEDGEQRSGEDLDESQSLDVRLSHAIDDLKSYHGGKLSRLGFFEALWDYLDAQYGAAVANRYLSDEAAEDKMWAEYTGEVEEGVMKNIKRGLQGWYGDDTGPNGENLGDPRELVRRNKSYDDETLQRFAKSIAGEKKTKHSPGELQQRVIDREMKKRGLGESDMSDGLSDAAHELALFADNDSQLYRSSETPIKTNLEKKAKKGVYDSELAKKLWKYHADRAAQRYAQEHGGNWKTMFTPDDRRQAAAYWEEAFREELMANGLLDEQFIMEREDDEDSYWDFKDLKDEPTSRTRKVAGTRYGGSAQIDDEEDDDDDKPSTPKKRGRPAGTAKKTGARRPGVYEEGVAEGSESQDKLVSMLNSFDYYSDNSKVYVNDAGDKIARQGSNWKHQSGKVGNGPEELGNFLSSNQGVAEGEESIEDLQKQRQSILNRCKHWAAAQDGSYEMALDAAGFNDIEKKISNLKKNQSVSEGNYHDADFVNKSERLERLRAMAKRQGDRAAFDKYNSEIKKLYNADVTTPASTFDESFDAKLNPAKKGMFDGRDKESLKKEYNKLKSSGPHKLGSAENTKMRELAFAIRAKSDWGKVS